MRRSPIPKIASESCAVLLKDSRPLVTMRRIEDLGLFRQATSGAEECFLRMVGGRFGALQRLNSPIAALITLADG